MLKKTITLFQIILVIGCARNQDSSKKMDTHKIEGLKAFAKVYGYVRYFHPSDEASEIDWGNLAIYGSQQIEKCNSKNEVVSILNEIFKPIAPTVNFYLGKLPLKYDLQHITPRNLEIYKTTYWQHQGLSLGMVNEKRNPYKSIRVGRTVRPDTNEIVEGDYKLFAYTPKFGEIIERQIADGIFCQIPLVLYANEESTYPSSSDDGFKKLKNELEMLSTDPANLSFRLGNVVNLYNVFQHFYPYMDVMNVEWDRELEKALASCYTDKTEKDHVITLQKFTAPLRDGHLVFSKQINKVYEPALNTESDLIEGAWEPYILPISWEWIEDNLVVTNIYGDGLPIKTGDVITEIDHSSPKVYFEKIYSRISAGTEGWLHYRANLLSLLGKKHSEIILTINGQNVKLTRDIKYLRSKQSMSTYQPDRKIINDSVIYLNLTRIPYEFILEFMPKLEKSKSIIWDLRGYPSQGSYQILSHLITKKDTAKTNLRIPQVIYPERNFVGYKTFPLLSSQILQIKQPFLGNKQNIFLTNGEAISAAESIMIYVKGYDLATVVGQPTAGTDGNVIKLWLPGGIGVTWTGMEMVKLDGSQLHSIGILPDIYANKTINGLIQGKDDVLERAIELTQKKK